MNKKKISLLTFSKSNSFGANLQCYALSKTLRDMGFEVELLDLALHRSTSSLIKRFFFRRKRFWSKHLPAYSPVCYESMEELRNNPPKADVYIVGSDQVWNPQIASRRFMAAYYLNFAPKGSKVISYAASFGSDMWEFPEYTSNIKEYLPKFDAISVREESGITICRDHFDATASVVCDPTILLEDYSELIPAQQRETNNLVFFSLRSALFDFQKIINLAKEAKMKIVSLSNTHRRGVNTLSYASIERWLKTMRDAKLIVTDSFHGLMFALIFNKQFMVVNTQPQRFERLRNMLNSIGLSDHICENQDEITTNRSWTTPIDYTKINKLLAEQRAAGKEFIKKNCL